MKSTTTTLLLAILICLAIYIAFELRIANIINTKDVQIISQSSTKTYDNDDFMMGMMNGKDIHTGMMIRNDQEFIEEMIPHHQEAIDSAKVIANTSTNPHVVELTKGMIYAQEKEVLDMKIWYKDWFMNDYSGVNSHYKPMMTNPELVPQTMRDSIFLQEMIKHHMMAIMMAKQLLMTTQRDELKSLSNDIINSQSNEIQKMQNILKLL